MITADEITDCFYRKKGHKYRVVIPNVYPHPRYKEMDIMAIRPSGYVEEIEVKLTKSDYAADFRKTLNIKDGLVNKNKHQALKEGLSLCNRFYFLMPQDLADGIVVPEHAGLYILSNSGWIELIKKAPLLHRRKITPEIEMNVLKNLQYRYWTQRIKL